METFTIPAVIQVTELPDTLCIHLKRFRHDFAFSSKISTRVQFEEVMVNLVLECADESFLVGVGHVLVVAQ